MRSIFLDFSLISFLFLASSCSHFHAQVAAESSAVRVLASEGWVRIGSSELEGEIAARRKKVEEFSFLAEYGRKNGLRIYAAGGTAVGYGSYVRQHMENEELKREGKPPKYFESRFKDYHYYDIFRSTQDADIVIDIPGGDAAAHEKAAQELEAVMKEKFGHLQGSKSVWEVRFLRVDRGTRGETGHKDALLGWDFQNQHTDSYSTGVIELTRSPAGESAVRDVKAWDSKQNVFLEDLAEGKIRFYLEKDHEKTLRASKGMNPEILSVIRFYTKAFQYGAKIPAEEEAKLLPLIQRFDPSTASTDAYVAKQIRSNGLKLYWHAIDVERASLELDRVDLKSKLIAYGKRTDPKGVASQRLSVWLARKPLPSYPIGKGPKIAEGTYPGYRPSLKTARELGIMEVAHETDQYLAYENILRAAKGFPNVFESIKGQEGQSAVYGDGWYAKIGRKGARDSGFTIRSKLDPDAVEGIDFFVYEPLGFVISRNRNALTVIDESLSMTPLAYVERLLSQNGVDRSDRGLLEALSKKANTRTDGMSGREKSAIRKLLLNNLDRFDEDLIRVWFSQSLSRSFPELVDALIDKGTVDYQLVVHVLPQSHWPQRGEWVERFIAKEKSVPIRERGGLSTHAHEGLTLDELLVESLFSKEPQEPIQRVEGWVDALLKKRSADEAIAMYVVSHPRWSHRRDWGSLLLERGSADYAMVKYAMQNPYLPAVPEWLEILFRKIPELKDRNWGVWPYVAHALTMPHWLNHPVLRAVSYGRSPTLEIVAKAIQNGRFSAELKKFRAQQAGGDSGCARLVKMKI
jgi:hypothetical protein